MISRSLRPARAVSLAEVVCAFALASVLVGVQAGEVARQQRELRLTAGAARARAALRATYEQLVGGVVTPPAPGAVVTLEGHDRVEVTLERVPAEGALAAPGLVCVEVRAAWRDASGAALERRLTALVAEGGAR